MVRATLHEHEIRRAIGVPGDGDLVIDGVAPLGTPADRRLYFVSRELREAERDALAARSDSIVIVRRDSSLAAELTSCRVLETSDPRAAIAKVLELIVSLRRQQPWIESREISPDANVSRHAVVEGNVRIAEGVEIEPFCMVGPDVSIGRGSVIRSGARIGPRVRIGEECRVGANTVIGTDGFGFVAGADGTKTLIQHLAGVVVGSQVQIGATAVVEAGVLTPTTIEDHVKMGDCAGIGHGSRIGRAASLVGGAGVGGSVVIGEEAWIGMNATVRSGRRVGARALVGMDVSVQDDLPDGAVARAARPEVRERRARRV
jgi:UDP-3-O-[3-hydroxymyristoyl] glucosamine N-acyltransferase